MDARLADALKTVADALGAIDRDDFERACEMIGAATVIGIYGCGREGLQMRGFAMRLFHLGLDVGCLGDVSMPRLGEGDLLVVSAGPGELATVTAHMSTARAADARVLFITAQPDTPAARIADQVLIVPAQTMAS